MTPDWMSGTLQLNDALSITYNRLYIVIFTLIVFAALLVVLKRTRIGLDIRAVSQNRAMAKAMGIRTEWVDAMTFGLGSGIAGVAGVALSQLTNVGPNLGQSYIIDSFMVVVFGGVGNLWGSLVGGMSMGIVNELLEPYAGAVLAKIFVLVALILFIQSAAARTVPANRPRVGEPVVMARNTRCGSARGTIGDRMVSGRARAGRCRGAHPQSGCARVVAVSPFGLRTHADRQVPVLRDAGAGGRSDLGILRHSEPRARGLFFARRLRDGHVSDAADRPQGRVRRSRSCPTSWCF